MKTIKKVKQRLKLGEILVRMKYISPEQLEEALKIQEEEGKDLRHLLIERDYVTEEDVLKVVSDEYTIPYLDLSSYVIDKKLFSLLSKEMVSEYQIVPLESVDHTVTFAISSPLEEEQIDRLEDHLQRKTHFFIARESEIQQVIDKVYSATN